MSRIPVMWYRALVGLGSSVRCYRMQASSAPPVLRRSNSEAHIRKTLDLGYGRSSGTDCKFRMTAFPGMTLFNTGGKKYPAAVKSNSAACMEQSSMFDKQWVQIIPDHYPNFEPKVTVYPAQYQEIAFPTVKPVVTPGPDPLQLITECLERIETRLGSIDTRLTSVENYLEAVSHRKSPTPFQKTPC